MASTFIAQGPHAERLDDVPRYLWHSKEWADMLVVCRTAEIRVHRAVVCSRSRFFDSSCRLGFETATGRINLTEEADVVEGLLESLYGVKISLFELGEANIMVNIDKLIQLYAASDKYAVPELQLQVVDIFASRLQAVTDPSAILEVAASVYNKTPYFDINLRAAMLYHVQTHLDIILSDDETSTALLENSQMSLDIMKRVAPVLREQATALSVSSSNTSSPKTSKKRKSPRLPPHSPGAYALRIRMN